MIEQAPVHTIPTELERQDAFVDLAALAGVVLVAWYLLLHDAVWWAAPFVVVVAIWTLTGEPAADVPYIGAIASGLRSKLGLRRAHEWVQAWWHYFQVRTWRDWRAWWASSPSIPVVAPPLRQIPAGECLRAGLILRPTTNYAVASAAERSDQMEALGRVLMGLSHPLQLVGMTRERPDHADWPVPPRLERRWLAIVTAADESTLAWRIRTLRTALEGIGLRCEDYADLVIRERVQPRRDHVVAGAEYAATLVLRRWPREVAPGWLGQALAGDLPVDLAIHVRPQDPQRIARFLRRQQSWQTDAGADAGNELGRSDAERVRLKLVARTDRPCGVAIALTVRANSLDTLRQRVETLKHEIQLVLGDAREATFEQDLAIEATLPNGICRLIGAWRTLDCASVASTWPFQPATIDHADGAPLGTTRDGSMLVRLDPFDPSLESFGGIVVAKVGMGKSYLLKLLARRLEEVEVLIVEQRTPAEYSGIVGATTVNLADVPFEQRAEHLRSFVSDLWEAAKVSPRPRLLVLDELWSLLRDPALAALIEEIARIGRHHYLALWIATQQCRELLESGRAVIDNAAVRVYLKQHDRDLEDLCDAVGLAAPVRRFLRAAARGQAVLDCGGLLVPLAVQASPDEHREITTDPREKRHGRSAELGGAGWRAGAAGVADRLAAAESAEVDVGAVDRAARPAAAL